MTSGNLADIVNTLKKIIILPDFYWQILAISIAIISAVLCYKFGRRFFFSKEFFVKENYKFLTEYPIFSKIIIKFIRPLLLQALIVIFLLLGTIVYSIFYDNIFWISAVTQIALLLSIIKIIKLYVGSSFIVNIAKIFLVPTLILNIFGLLGAVTEYLDSSKIRIGSVKISFYDVIDAIFTIIVTFWILGFIAKKVKLYVNQQTIKSSTKGMVNKIVDISNYIIVTIVLLKVSGVNTTTFTVIGGAVGVGIGLGMQKIASNFICGIILLFEKSVEVGDIIELAENDGREELRGTITHFGGRYSLLETFDGKEVMVPNEELVINRVTNLTYNNTRTRIRINIRVSYDENLKFIQDIMIQSAKDHPACLYYPGVECRVIDFEECFIKIALLFWIGNVLEGMARPKSDVMINIMEKFKENNIKIPVPKREIVIDDVRVDKNDIVKN